MRDNGLLVLLAVPAVQLNAATAGEQHAPIHLHRRLATELSAYQISIVRRVDKIVTQRLIHVLIDIESVEKHGRIVVRHEIVVKALYAELLFGLEGLVRLVRVYQAQYAVAVVVGENDFV